MKLYYSPGACSLAPHILLEESGLPYTAQKIIFDQGDGDTEEFKKLSPFGYIPILELSDGRVLSEGVAIQLYIADQVPALNLVPRAGSFERAKLHGWMTLISSEIHKGFTPLFGPQAYSTTPAGAEEVKTACRDSLGKKLTILNSLLGNTKYIMGEQFTPADSYLFVIFGWAEYVGLKKETWPNLCAHAKTMMERPAVIRAMKSEGLLD